MQCMSLATMEIQLYFSWKFLLVQKCMHDYLNFKNIDYNKTSWALEVHNFNSVKGSMWGSLPSTFPTEVAK